MDFIDFQCIKGIGGGSLAKMRFLLILKKVAFVFQPLFTEPNYLLISQNGGLRKKEDFSQFGPFPIQFSYIK